MEGEKVHRDPLAQGVSDSTFTNSIADDSVNSIYDRKIQIPGYRNQVCIYSSVGDAVIAEDGLLSGTDVARDLVLYNIGATQIGAELNENYEEADSVDEGSQDGCDSGDWENNHSGNIEFCEIERAETQNPLLMGTSTAFGTNDWHDFEQESNGGTFISLDLKALNKPHDSPHFPALFDTIDAQSMSEGSEVDGSVEEKRIEDISTNNSHPEVRSNSSHDFEATPLNEILLSTELAVPTQEQSIIPNDFDDDIVREMEEILLVPKGQTTSNLSPLESPRSFSSPDGGLFASTSSFKDFNSPPKISAVEVIGAKQKKGNVSFSERIVGVKEYTVYSIRVWSEEHHWVVERRYREFYSLYCNLKSYFLDHGWILPSEWSALEQESRKLFGSSSPDVVKERSTLIQNCLQSIIKNDSFPSFPGEFHWFLSSVPASSSSYSERVSLLVEDHQEKPLNQILESQLHQCFGCRKKLNNEMGILRGLAQSLGWGNPRLCMYTGQVFCSSCHVNDHAILPSRVLHHWDFTQYPVSQSSRSYLDSIYDQPMLCVSAVNPFLYSKVPALHHVVALRKKLETIVSFVKCPFRNTVSKALGPRKYLLESSDFFALRDLVDLSKGSFAALPGMLQACTIKITDHIVESCLICYDVGVPCGSRQACADPSSLVFPFQEDDVDKCEACGLVYHRLCYMKVGRCSCGADGRRGNDMSFASKLLRMSSRNLLGGSAGWFPSLRFSEPLFRKSDEVNDNTNNNFLVLDSLPTENFHD